MPNSYTAIPITIDNTQTSATPAPFQQMITVDMNTYSSLANSTLSNVFFLDNNGNPITSWLESGNSNTSTSTVYWLLLPLGIPANSSITVYMCFDNTSNNDFDGITRGEAPQLSSTYGEYDNGANVFNAYWNFAGTSLPSGLTIGQTGGTYSVNNGLTITGGSGYEGILSTSSINPQTTITDFYGYLTGTGNYNSQFGLYGNTSGGEPQYFIWTPVADNYSLLTYDGTIGTETTITTSGSQTSSSVWSMWASTTYAYASYNYGTAVSNNANFVASTAQYIGIFAASTSNGAFVQWLRVRAYPPNDILPVYSYGLIVQTTITTSGSGSASAVATFLTSQAIQSTGLGSATASFILSQATSGQGSGSALASFILSQALNGKGLASTTVSLIASGLASTPEGLAKTSFFILAVSPLSGKTNASGDYNTVVSAAASLNNPTYPTSETLNYSATYLPPNTNVSSVSSSLNSSATITFTYSNTSSYTSPTLTTIHVLSISRFFIFFMFLFFIFFIIQIYTLTLEV